MISLCITSWNRDSMTVESFRYVLNDDRISEIVIADDCSDDRIYQNLLFMTNGMDKVKVYRNYSNLGCYHNKRNAVSLAKNEWVILLDSDNVIKTEYIDAIYETFTAWPPRTDLIWQPEFARPHFDFRKFSGSVISKENVKGYVMQNGFTTMLNAMNFFVNRDQYLKVFDQNKAEPWTADSIYFNYLWLKAGNKIYVTPGMQYDHLVHEGSHYKNNVHKTGNFYREVEQMIMNL
jgi:glycosyltransferase involved in cell wall biosynthesis